LLSLYSKIEAEADNLPLTLLLKLVVTPILIAGATAVGRRWGETLSGWLVGLPFTSGPVVFFLALDQGRHFAATASIGVVLGVASQAIFALAYVYLGGRRGWIPGMIAGTVGYAAATVLFEVLRAPALVDVLLVAALLLVAITMIPRIQLVERTPGASGPGDLPLRIVVATALVVGLTAVAPALGARLSGLLSPFPLYAGILAVFAHRQGGFSAAAMVWRGLQFGLFAFLAFFSILAATLDRIGIAGAFLLAIAVALLVQTMTLALLRR
jgi:energy-converting hydrogenase Eha subunit B